MPSPITLLPVTSQWVGPPSSSFLAERKKHLNKRRRRRRRQKTRGGGRLGGKEEGRHSGRQTTASSSTFPACVHSLSSLFSHSLDRRDNNNNNDLLSRKLFLSLSFSFPQRTESPMSHHASSRNSHTKFRTRIHFLANSALLAVLPIFSDPRCFSAAGIEKQPLLRKTKKTLLVTVA